MIVRSAGVPGPAWPAYTDRARYRWRTGRARALLGGASAVLAWLTAVVGLPVVLLLLQRPVLDGFDPAAAVAQPMSAALLPPLCLAGGWLLWGWLVAATVLDGVAAARHRPGGPRLLPAPLRTVVTAMAGALVTAAMPGGGHAAAASPAAVQTIPVAAPPPTSGAGQLTAVPPRLLAADLGQPGVAARPPVTVTVQRGDTLWGIARDRLGNPYRWPELYRLNAARYDQGGRMRGGDHIQPTWVLVLPDAADPPPEAQPGNPPQQEPGTQTGPGPGKSTAPVPSTDPPPSVSATRSASTSSALTPTPSVTASPVASSAAASATTDPDGVVGPPQAGSSSPSTAPTSAAPPASDPAPTRSPSATPSRPHGIALPTGSWLDLGLATAIVAAVALVWAHRRRRYTSRPPSPDLRLGDACAAPMPPVVRQIRRRLRGTPRNVSQGEFGDPGQLDLFTDPDDTLDREHLRAHAGDDGDSDKTLDLDVSGGDVPHDPDEDDLNEDNIDEDAVDGAAVEPLPSSPTGDDERSLVGTRPAAPSLAHPLAAAWPPAGLGLTGPGAEAAARGFLAAGLAAGGLDEPDERSWVVMPAATAATLLGADAVALPHTPRLTVTAGLDEALDLLEAQTLHRSRIVYAHEVDTVAELRAADPTEEPLPPILLLLADATTRHQRTRLAALLAQGQHLDIHGVLLGAWPDGNTVVVAADGTTSPADGEGARHGNHPADIGRLAILTPTETSDLLATLAESHTGQPQAPAPVEPAAQLPAPAPATGPARNDSHAPPVQAIDQTAGTANSADAETASAANCGQPRREQPGTSPGHTPTGADGRTDGGTVPDAQATAAAQVVAPDGADIAEADAVVGVQPATPPDAGTEAAGGDAGRANLGTEEEPEADATAEDADTGSGRVEVTVLGTAGIVDVPPGPTLRKKSVEVLVYLAVHDGDASAEAILDDVMPDAPANKAPRRLYTYVSNLRTVMRRTGGRGTYINHPGQRYVLNPDAADVDLWRMRAAIRDAERATDPQERLAALRRAVDTYGGPLAEDADYEWIEPYREAVRMQALDASLALADALADKPAEQVTVLEAAIRHNPYTEQLYQQAMRARATLGHLDAIRTLRRALTRALGEIDAEPSDETIALADELVARAQRPGRRPDLRPAPRPGDGAAA